MTGMEDVVRICRVEGVEVERWIERAWVVPDRSDGGYVFTEADVARVMLVCDLRRDLAIDEDAIPVVLSLLDQVYALRRSLRRLGAAVDALPDAERRAVLERLAAPD